MGSAEAHTAATADAKPTTSRSPTQGIDSIETMGPTASAPASPGAPVPPTVKPSSDHVSTRTRRCTATAAGAAHPLLSTMALGLAGPLDHLPGVVIPRRESHGCGRPRPPPRTCSSRLSCPHGTHSVRPRLRRACGNSSLTTSAPSWRHTAFTGQVGCPWRRC